MAQPATPNNQPWFYGDYTTFIHKLETDTNFVKSLSKMYAIYIKNPKVVLHMPLSRGGDIPENGILFNHMGLITSIEDLEYLYLTGIFLEELPSDLTKLKKLKELQISFTSNVDIEKNLKILKRLPALKKLDLNGSRLSIKQRNRIKHELEEVGVFVNDWVYLSD